MPIAAPESSRSFNHNLVIKYHLGETYPWAVHGEDGGAMYRFACLESALWTAPRAAIDAKSLLTWQSKINKQISGRRTV